jgi:hypothetical protein
MIPITDGEEPRKRGAASLSTCTPPKSNQIHAGTCFTQAMSLIPLLGGSVHPCEILQE